VDPSGTPIVAKVHRGSAAAVAFLLQQGAVGRQRGLELTELLLEHHSRAPEVVVGLGLGSERFVDLGYLNASPGGEPVLVRLVEALRELARTSTDPEVLPMLLHALGRSARVLGRAWDDVAEAACLRAIELAPGDWGGEYDLGLFYKTRGRFQEGQAANQRAFDGGGSEDDSVRWNLGICATGAGDAEVALRVWKLLGQKVELGRFGLPEGGYDMVKVRLAQRPLAERSASETTQAARRRSGSNGSVRVMGSFAVRSSTTKLASTSVTSCSSTARPSRITR
jgi:hypothetical protein